ncbi:MAG: B12-binding domain-containing radical SAM protein [Candidatus Rokubacteria bacterium]|nr:B12-binding domain-containing radical SAM protein [Candidatus Rokubacteria bacterium]
MSRARRVLLYDPYDDFLQGPRDFTPLGILYLSAWLKRAGHDVHVLHEEIDALPAGFDVYGVSATTPQYPKARAALARIRELEPEAVVVLGGAHVNAPRCRREAIADGFDFVVWGEGEITLQAVVEGRIRRADLRPEQRIIEGAKIPAAGGTIDEVPAPDRAAIDIRRYGYPIEGRKAATLMTARECPFKCQFCSSAGGVPRFHSIDRVMDEVRYLVEDLGFRALLFVDDVFTFKEQTRLWPLMDRMQELHDAYGVIWRCYSRTDLGMRSLERMRRAGCLEVGAGIESGSQDILDVTMKYTTTTGNLGFIEACAKADVMPNTFLMIGLPAETETTVRETREWFARAAETFSPTSSA